MKQLFAFVLLVSALPALAYNLLAYDLKLADCPTTTTNEVVTATLPYINVTSASQFALCITAHMEQTQAGGTNLVWLPGTVSCVASNSIDGQTWFANAAHGFSLSVPTNGIITLQTNFIGMGAIGYERFTVTVSNAVNMTWTSAVKPGL